MSQYDPELMEEDSPDLKKYIGILLEGKWIIIGVTVLALAIGLVKSRLPAPVYETSALIQVEKEQGGMQNLLGEDFGGSMTRSPIYGSTSAHIQILKSRGVLTPAAKSVDLDTMARPRHYPYFGEYFARRADPGDGLAEPFLGLTSYAWGGEEIQVQRLEVEDSLRGRTLKLEARKGDRYRLFLGKKQLLEGRVGEPAHSESPRVDLFISRLKARPGTLFSLRKRRLQATVSGLKSRLRVREKGQYTGILQLSIRGKDPEQIRDILNAVARTYQRQNVERQSAQAEKSLEFLQEQLPKLKGKLRSAEQKIVEFREEHSAIDLTSRTQSLLDRMVDLEKRISELSMKRSELSNRFGEKHPRMQSVQRKQRELKQKKAELQADIRKLPDFQQELLHLKRDVEVHKKLYTSLLNKAQELRLVKAGTIGNVRIVEQALRPLEPSGPNRSLPLAAGLILGLLGGSGLVFVRNALRTGIRDPDTLSAALGLSMFAVVPYSRSQDRDSRHMNKGKRSTLPLLAADSPKSPTVEALRSLRTSLAFALLESQSNVVSFTSPIPLSGKTFVTVNLGRLVAEAGQRVLVMDGDMRKGHIHHYLNRDRKPGLSDMLAGRASEEEIKVTQSDNFTLVCSGTLPPNPSELLMSRAFMDFLARARQDYDLVLIDTPPLIPVTDATIIGAQAGARFMIVRAGITTQQEADAAAKRAKQHGAPISGLVFNDFRPQESYGKYGYYGGRYRYYSYKYE